ncbi:class I SAM-dependent methyltransferase [Halobaculum sp. EA56]|uniref:class I SAM-dependent methyltransferase n=1 Tax=Halobaculum sp. EA56 TaxID=3421648 RepID=UPI003EC12055
MPPADEDLVAQYADASSLADRGSFNERFSTADRHPHRWLFDHVEVPAEGTVVEVGCGNGSLWAANADRIPGGVEAVLTDVSPGMVRDARDRLREAGVDAGVRHAAGDAGTSPDGAPVVRYAVAEAGAVPVRDGAADVAFANQMLYHVPDLDAAVRELRRVLAGDGVLYATARTRRSKRRLFEIADETLDDDVTPPNAGSTFVVENGRAALERAFDDVRLHTLDSSAVVDDPDALVAYLASMREFAGVPEFGPAAADRLRERFAAETADGPLVLQGLFGAFEARP